MPERTEEQIPKPDLGQRVEEVLKAIDATCADLERQARTTEENELAELEELADRAVGDDGKPIEVSDSEPESGSEPEPTSDSESTVAPESSETTASEAIPASPESVEDDGPTDEPDEEPQMEAPATEPAPESVEAPQEPDQSVETSSVSESATPEADREDIGVELDDMFGAMEEVVASMEDQSAASATPDASTDVLEPESSPEPVAESEPVTEPEPMAQVAGPAPETASESEPLQVNEAEDGVVEPVAEHSEPTTDLTPDPEAAHLDDALEENDTSVGAQPPADGASLDAPVDDELADLAEELGDELDAIASELVEAVEEEAVEEETVEEPTEEVDGVAEVDIPIEYDDVEDSSPEPEPAAVATEDQTVESARSPEPEIDDPGSDAPPEDIEAVLTDAVEVASAEQSESEEESESKATIEQLDEELAGLAEELVDGDFEDATGEVAEPVDIPDPVADEPDSLGDTSPIDEPTEPIADSPVNDDLEPEHQDDDKPSGGKVIEPKPTDQPVWAKVRDTALTLASKVGQAAVPIGARVLLLVGKPTSKLPSTTRDTIGWLGLYTAFLAACVWGFLLFFRKPVMPEPTAETVGISGEVVASNAPAED